MACDGQSHWFDGQQCTSMGRVAVIGCHSVTSHAAKYSATGGMGGRYCLEQLALFNVF